MKPYPSNSINNDSFKQSNATSVLFTLHLRHATNDLPQHFSLLHTFIKFLIDYNGFSVDVDGGFSVVAVAAAVDSFLRNIIFSLLLI